MPNDESRKQERIWYIKTLAEGFLTVSLVTGAILLLAGRVTYWQGWVFGGSLLLIFLVSSVLFADKVDLVKERRKPGPGTKWWDKVFYALYIPAFFAVVVVAGLDAGRYGWTAHLPLSLYAASYVIYALSNLLTLWAMWANRFFSSTVRIQTDRGHEVVEGGPYRIVRHPGYVGAILLATSISLVLGSLWALIPAGVVAVLLIVRTCLEDTTLQRELTGYADYARRVRFRLVPGIW
ncbi:MAG: isoprenylcysteine carboxylmethyltransferase family protein [Candidatus Abyssubacteria bacterium]|nr:isoprenylcysteine carboxylmethyltransferase family protein [Candidatus Abyssubacteria bacterium]